MHPAEVRAEALRLHAAGVPFLQISRSLGIARSTVREWSTDPDRALRARPAASCFVCAGMPCPSPRPYAYLLGQYLGDGHLVVLSRVTRLRIACADSYPRIAAEVDVAMGTLSGHEPGFVQSIGCSDRYSYWKHWPCLFPQHGHGRKHERPIVLAQWQCDLVEQHPWPLIRGLIHSDGCRALNNVTVRGRRYSYPRYFFANESRDILRIMGDALDLVGVAWRYNRPNSISVARRAAVAKMELHIGPKR